MTSTMCRRRIAKCASLIGFMAFPTLMLVLVRSTRFAGRDLAGWVVARRLTLSWGNQIRTAGRILVFIDRGGPSETNTDGTALVDIGGIRRRSASLPSGFNIAAIRTAL